MSTPARFAGTCRRCGGPFAAGDPVEYTNRQPRHPACPPIDGLPPDRYHFLCTASTTAHPGPHAFAAVALNGRRCPLCNWPARLIHAPAAEVAP